MTERDSLPVLYDAEQHQREIERTPAALPPAVVQAATIAVSGFVAGAGVFAVLHRLRGRRTLRRARRGRRRGADLTRIVSSRSFLVDVHLLGRD